MNRLTRREAITRSLGAGLALAVAPGQLCAAEKSKPLTPEQILADKVVGQVRVELVVVGWVQYEGLLVGPGEPQLLRLKGGRLDRDRLDVLVDQKVLDRFAALGIDDPKKHFEEKTLVVSGKVNRNQAPMGETSIILWIDNLDQIESIAKK